VSTVQAICSTDKVQALESALDTERADCKRQLENKDMASSSLHQILQDEAESLKEERDDLVQRLRLAERQLARLHKPEVRHACMHVPAISIGSQLA
jgi:hypothetical protein